MVLAMLLGLSSWQYHSLLTYVMYALGDRNGTWYQVLAHTYTCRSRVWLGSSYAYGYDAIISTSHNQYSFILSVCGHSTSKIA